MYTLIASVCLSIPSKSSAAWAYRLMSISRCETVATTSWIRSGTWFIASLTAFSHTSSSVSWFFVRSAVTLRYASIACENSRASSSARPRAINDSWFSDDASPRMYAECSAAISATRCGRNSRAIRVASCQRAASLYALTASSGFLARTKSASASVNLDSSTHTLACATSTSGIEPGSFASATRVALAQFCWCTYMSIASFGLSALMNSFSASSNRPSSSRYMAYFKCTSGSFSLREAIASSKACSKAPDSVA
mmetsp:Transcript_38832/g.96480  ORF Transcript_38832/g.96480 Transcript_38832/m.96480 type:complete len:253 (+) Transcript_38832:1323-2081(+)